MCHEPGIIIIVGFGILSVRRKEEWWMVGIVGSGGCGLIDEGQAAPLAAPIETHWSV